MSDDSGYWKTIALELKDKPVASEAEVKAMGERVAAAEAKADERLDALLRIAAVINNHFNTGGAPEGALAAVAAILGKPWEDSE